MSVIARTEEEFYQLFEQYKIKNPNAIIKAKEQRFHPPPSDETIIQPFKKEKTYRVMAQISVNCLVHWYGTDVLKKPLIEPH